LTCYQICEAPFGPLAEPVLYELFHHSLSRHSAAGTDAILPAHCEQEVDREVKHGLDEKEAARQAEEDAFVSAVDAASATDLLDSA
jgi:hypothetical protein